MATATEKDLKELKDEYASLKSDLSKMNETLSKLAHDSADEGRARIRSAAKQSQDQARETWGTIESEIEQRPVTSLAVALGVGFVLGKLLSR